jgi:tetratricopeptide (TPR) repeat protein
MLSSESVDPAAVSDAPSADPEVFRPRRGATQPTRMRSGRPPELDPDGAQSLLAIATLLDEGLYTQALSALDRAGARAGPEFTLMRARALHGAERDSDAGVLLEQLCAADSLPADVRAGCARLLLELGNVDAALAQAELAHRQHPQAPVTIQTLVWALCRVSWQRPQVLDRIPPLLDTIDSDRGPRRALAQSLRAYVACTLGTAEHGAEAAEAALDLDPKSRDALLALAIAWARLGDHQRSAHYVQRFASQHPGADVVAKRAVAHWVGRDQHRSR